MNPKTIMISITTKVNDTEKVFELLEDIAVVCDEYGQYLGGHAVDEDDDE